MARIDNSGSRSAPRPKPANFINPKALKDVAAQVQKDIKKLANSSNSTVKTNKDGSVSRSSTTTKKQTTQSKELTTSKGPLGESKFKYATTSKTGGTTAKNTRTTQSDVFGRTTSTHQREVSREKGNTAKTETNTKTTDHRGTKKEVDAKSTKVTTGNTSKTDTRSVTTDSHGNKAVTKESSTATKNGNTTTTKTSKETTGTERTNTAVSKFEDGKYTLGNQTDWKNNKFNKEVGFNKEKELKPSSADSGFTQAKKDKLSRAQTAGDLLGAAGVKKEWKSEFNHIKENNTSKTPGTFVGSRVGTSGSQSFSVGADGVNAAYNREAKAGLYAEKTGKTTGKYGEASYKAGAQLEAKASVDAKGKLNTNGLDASVSAKASASAEVNISGKAQTKSVKVAGVDLNASVEGKAKASAEVSAEATGKVKVTRNPPTAIAEGTVGASAVAKVEGEVKASAGPFAVKASAYASAGAEAKATGVIGYEDGKLKIGGSAGAALGLGAGASATVEIDVKQVGEMAKNTAVAVADANHDGKLGLDDAKAIASSAKKKVLGWIGL
ncbi:hypothetical protein JGU66_35120 [Myxococcaceae bacterium JPH2]|nr:hypothetical protein [Myxococcaceae bacterium JPH2]